MRLLSGKDDFASERLELHIDKAISNQVDRYVKALIVINTNIEANARTYFKVGEKLVSAGKTDKAIDVWLDGLAARRSPRIATSEGDWFITKLDSYAENLAQKQRTRYLSILKKQIHCWKDEVTFNDAVVMISNKYQEILIK